MFSGQAGMSLNLRIAKKMDYITPAVANLAKTFVVPQTWLGVRGESGLPGVDFVAGVQPQRLDAENAPWSRLERLLVPRFRARSPLTDRLISPCSGGSIRSPAAVKPPA
jgi:hypothetical protein